MAELFLLDVKAHYREGDLITLERFALDDRGPLGSAPAQRFEQHFPGGLTREAADILLHDLDGDDANALAQPLSQWAFELVRLGSYPTKPSRFQAVSCFDDRPAALASLQAEREGGHPRAQLWVIDAEPGHRGDVGPDAYPVDDPEGRVCLGDILRWAHLYWSGEPAGVQPRWEVLAVPPVRVLRLVDEATA